MNADPAVRSVRIAVTLCERFAELLQGPSTVTARKQSGALFGVSGNEEALSLRIGEVQQIYPEIWRHLDEARAAFAGRGVDVSAFDQIRASEGLALGAAVDVKHTRHGVGQYAVDENVKSANFNREGYTRACKAYEALMRATPDIDWAGIARAEAEDPNIKAFTRSTTTKRWVMIGLLVAVIAAPFVYVGNTCRKKQARIDANQAAYREAQQLSEGERAQLDNAVAQARQTYATALQAWTTAVTKDALAAITPSAKPCEYRFDAPSAKAAESFVKYGSVDANYFGTGAFVSFSASEAVRDDQLRGTASAIEHIANLATRGNATRAHIDELRKLPTHVVFVVIDREVEPLAGTGTAYTPGEVAGRSYVFSVAQKRLVCAGTVDVRNAPNMETSPRDDEAKMMLFRDLEMQIRQALATGLRAI